VEKGNREGGVVQAAGDLAFAVGLHRESSWAKASS